MKRFVKIFLMALIIGGGSVSAQYQMTLKNAVQLTNKVFRFDVYVVSTGADFNLTSYGLRLACSSAMVNGGTLGISYVAGSSAISFVPAGVDVSAAGGVTYLGVASWPGNQTVSTTPLKLGTFEITNTAAFGITPASMAWDFAGDIPTLVNINNLIATVPANHINALSPYRVVAQNDLQVNATTYEFDVDIVRTTADFTLTSYQVCFTYNPAVVNGGTLTFSYVPGTSGLTAISPLNPIVVNDGGTSNVICGSTPGTQPVTGLSLRVGRFRVTNTVPFGVAPMNLAWDFSGNFVTQINISNSNVTLPANHLSFLGNAPLPVELVSFTGASAKNAVQLAWKTATEINNYGFEIQRKSETTDWKKLDFTQGHGNSNAASEYTYTDKHPIAGKVQYRLKQIDVSGNVKYYAPIEVTVALPKEFTLMQNSPNPFNPTTTINYQVPASALVSIVVYDMLGREVATLVNETKQPGTYAAEWNGRDDRGQIAASGVYLYRLTAGNFVSTKKMNLMK